MLKLLKFIFICVFVTSASAYAEDSSEIKVTAMPNFNINSYLGTWYEIARMPIDYEEDCSKAISVAYTMKKNSIAVKTQCTTTEHKVDISEGIGYLNSKAKGAGQLKVNFASKWLRWTKYGNTDYWVLNTDYTSFAIVGSPDHQYVWIFSRTPNMDVKQLQTQVSFLQNLGYDISTLIYNKSSIE